MYSYLNENLDICSEEEAVYTVEVDIDDGVEITVSTDEEVVYSFFADDRELRGMGPTPYDKGIHAALESLNR